MTRHIPGPANAALADMLSALRDYTLDAKGVAVIVRQIQAATWLSEERRAALLAEVGRVAR